MIELEVPEIYDNFRSDSNLPVQAVMKLSMDSIGIGSCTVDVECEGRIYRYYPNIYNMLGFRVELPVGFGQKKDKKEVHISVKDSKGRVVESKTCIVNISGSVNMMLDSDVTPDLLYMRMLHNNNLFPSASVWSEIGVVPPKGGKANDFGPEAVASVMCDLFDYFLKYDLEPIEVKGDRAVVPSIVDITEMMVADPISLGLLFMHMADKMGYKPCILVSKDTCLVGICVDEFFCFDSPYWNRLVDLDFGNGELFSMNRSGRFLMMDITKRNSFDEAVQSALDRYGSMDVKHNGCYIPYEDDKEYSMKFMFSVRVEKL